MTGIVTTGPGGPLAAGALFSPVSVKVSAYTANPGEFVPADTTSGAFAVALPAAPADGAAVAVKMVKQGGTSAVTVTASAGATLNTPGGGTSLALSLPGQGAIFQYRAAIGVWYVLADDLPLPQLDARYIAVPAAVSPAPSKYAPLLYGAIWGWPGKYYPDAYNCKGDGIMVGDGVMTSGSPLLACASTGPFKPGDVAVKTAMVQTAAGAYAHIMQPIATYLSPTQVNLGGNATANTGGTPGAIVIFGTDDTANMKTCWAAADAWGAAHGNAEICFDPAALYTLASPFTVGGATLGNFMLPLPNVSQLGQHYELFLNGGAEDSSPFPNWGQLVPQLGGGATLACLRVDGTNNGTYGPAHIIGGPINGMGGETGASTGWSNLHLVVKGLNTLSPYNATFGGMDLFATVSQYIHSFSALTASVVPTSGAPVPNMASAAHISNQWGWGLRLAGPGNDASIHVNKVRVQGHCYGLGISEWSDVKHANIMYCVGGIAPFANGISMAHAAWITHAQVENCTNPICATDNGTYRLFIKDLQTESVGGLYDPTSQANGTVVIRPQNGAGTYKTGGWMQSGTGGANLTVINGETIAGTVTGGPALASGTAWFNYFSVPLELEVSVSGGTFTSLLVGGVARAGAVGATSYEFTLGPGVSYTPTVSAGTLSHVLQAAIAAA